MNNKLIFFVDDEKTILNLLEYTFSSRDGYMVKSFTSGEDCIENLNMKPSIVVVDHMLWTRNDSDMTGLDVLKEIRKQDSDTSVIVLSGNDEKSLIDEYYQNGATKYITKNSFFIDTLIDVIKEEFAQNSRVE